MIVTRFVRPLCAVVLLLAGALPAGAVPGGSIVCRRNTAPDEKAICADKSLVQLDYRMTRLYKRAAVAAGMGSRGDIKDGQAKWLETRHACKDDAGCLRDVYEARIARLTTMLAELKARSE